MTITQTGADGADEGGRPVRPARLGTIASKISVTPVRPYASSECTCPLDARSACTGRPSATTGASRGRGHSLTKYSQTGVTLVLEATVAAADGRPARQTSSSW